MGERAADYRPPPALLDACAARSMRRLGARDPAARRCLADEDVRRHLRVQLALTACFEATRARADHAAWTPRDIDAYLRGLYENGGEAVASALVRHFYVAGGGNAREEKEEEPCSICGEALAAAAGGGAAGRACGHRFHAKCTARWALASNAAAGARGWGQAPCPLCRAEWPRWPQAPCAAPQ